MILVTGAGGSVGHAVLRDLNGRGEKVRAFVKDEKQAEGARADGATDVVIGDIRSAADVLAATVGVRRLFHVHPTSLVHEVSIAEDIVAACLANGVEHIVYHSVIHPEITEMFHHQEKGRVEEVFRRSGIACTNLRASHFMQNYLDFWEFMQGGVLPYPSSPNSVMGVVDAEDVSEVAANILAAPEGHENQTYDLSSEELDRHEMARIWSDVLGHPVSAVRLPPASLQNPLRGAGALVTVVAKSLLSTKIHAPQHVIRGLQQSSNARGIRNWSQDSRDCYERMMNYYDKNGLPAGDMTELPKLLGRPATTYREFAVREAARRGVRPR
ncbi:NmrA family protein [Rhodococcus sp. 05-340-1]|uniref:SDR family oxidoreductase n=1 Tax=unclassified Rhodococcus (in: high G+C Gram-positive bacteria) TaxID=192944 RepID=UPI000B9C24B9|nr:MULTISPECIES: NmrA family NAD(P)-binding protein [unclassified Rhodococcus (in: high G+C Gram-positive bacteria)]OZD62155.1 NmrA family protein [Rhodococcus sp. 05-340-2]OZD78386.1 NmrA family protein [Rhodococcus sp. 05-340-1]